MLDAKNNPITTVPDEDSRQVITARTQQTYEQPTPVAAGTVANDLADEQPIINITPNNDHDDNTTTTHLTTEVVEDESSLAKDLNVNLKPVEMEIVKLGMQTNGLQH